MSPPTEAEVTEDCIAACNSGQAGDDVACIAGVYQRLGGDGGQFLDCPTAVRQECSHEVPNPDEIACSEACTRIAHDCNRPCWDGAVYDECRECSRNCSEALAACIDACWARDSDGVCGHAQAAARL